MAFLVFEAIVQHGPADSPKKRQFLFLPQIGSNWANWKTLQTIVEEQDLWEARHPEALEMLQDFGDSHSPFEPCGIIEKSGQELAEYTIN